MSPSFLLKSSILTVLMLGATLAQAQVDVPEEELAKESVLPRFERGEAVKNRNVVTANRVEIGGFAGWNFTEPIYNQTKAGLNLGYHFNETHSFMLNIVKWMEGRNSQYTDLLSKQGLDFMRAPNLEMAVWGNYELKAYYGKMSLSKNAVTNLHLYPILGAGISKYTHKVYPGVNAGLGMKFYFTENFAMRFDFKLQMAQGVNPFLGGGKLITSNPKPSPSDFGEKFYLGTILDVGLSILL